LGVPTRFKSSTAAATPRGIAGLDPGKKARIREAHAAARQPAERDFLRIAVPAKHGERKRAKHRRHAGAALFRRVAGHHPPRATRPARAATARPQTATARKQIPTANSITMCRLSARRAQPWSAASD